MAEIVVQKVQKNNSRSSKRELYAMVCYYYSQYTLKEAAKLTARDINLLITTARKIEAQKMYNLTQIAAAPHTKNGNGVKSILKHFKRLAS